MPTATEAALLQHKVIAILRGIPPEHLPDLARALAEGGVRLMEVTFDPSRPETWADTAQGIRRLAGLPGGVVVPGAGTVLTLEQLRMAADAGARYIISPHADAAIIKGAKALGLLSIPGCATATEAVAAHNAGADFIKLFPAGALGIPYLKALRSPLSHLRWMAVGGVTLQNMADFLAAGCVGVGIGSGLFESAWLREGAWNQVTDRAKAFAAAAAGGVRA